MNIQDVADFISLVKDPAKFESYLTQLVEEQNRLKAVIETIGQVEEIEAIKIAIKKQALIAEQQQADLLAKIQQDRLKEATAATIALAETKATQEKYRILLQELQQTQQETKDLNAQAKKREKDLVSKQAELQEKLTNVEALKLELEDRLAKLKAVMV
jgi:murein DD-endopeptidase MepM/ murein hydrolase activator NlpD